MTIDGPWLPIPTYELHDNTKISSDDSTATSQPPCNFVGTYCTLTPLDADLHTCDLYSAYLTDDATRYQYVQYGPFTNANDLHTFILAMTSLDDARVFAVMVDNKAVGFVGYLCWDATNGTVEVALDYSTQLSHTPAATEAMYMLVEHAIRHCKYRRVEWRCNAMHKKSFNAALRFGFAFEGVWKNADVVKGRNRNTAWFSVTDDEWDVVAAEFVRYLKSDNFTGNDQRTRLNGFDANSRNDSSVCKESDMASTHPETFQTIKR